MKLDKGNSKNHHVIRPRNVDQNKRLLISSDKEEFSAEMRIPRCTSIEVPIIEEVSIKKQSKKPFKLPSHYIRYSLLPNDQLDNLIDYETTESDLDWLFQNRNPKGLNLESSTLLEKTFLVWENDTSKGQIIPWERAWYLMKEEKVVDDSASDEILKYFEAVFRYWIEKRNNLGRPLIRRFWKSEGISDSQVKIAFQSRPYCKERRRLRNSKKNNQETYDKMKALLKHFEELKVVFKGIFLRECLKKSRVEHIKAAFDQERSEKGLKNLQVAPVDESSVELSKEFRRFHSFVEPVNGPVHETVQYLGSSERIDFEKPVKRVRPEVAVVRKKDLNQEIARACCFLIAEGEKLQKWPFIENGSKGQAEISVNSGPGEQVGSERALKMRGRVSRNGKRIVIDRLCNSEYEHRWGRYLGLRGVWHTFDGESMQDEYENDDIEAVIRVQKMILQNFKPLANKNKK